MTWDELKEEAKKMGYEITDSLIKVEHKEEE